MKVTIQEHDTDSRLYRDFINQRCSAPIMVFLDKYWFLLCRNYDHNYFIVTPEGRIFEEIHGAEFMNSDTARFRCRALISQWAHEHKHSVPDTGSLYSLWQSALHDLRRFAFRYDNEKKEWVNVYL